MTTPTGNLALTLYNLETLICSSAAFRSEVSAADVSAARTSVYWLGETAPPQGGEAAFAWIQIMEGFESNLEHGGGGGANWHTMPLQVLFERPDVAADTAKERQIKFWNWIGGVIGQIEALAKTSGYLWVTGMTLKKHYLSDTKEDGHFQQAIFDVKVM